MIGPLFKSLKLVIYQSISTITIMNLSRDLDVEQVKIPTNFFRTLKMQTVFRFILYFWNYSPFDDIRLCKDFQINE